MATLDYATATQIKALIPDTTWSTTYDTLLGTYATYASRLIDRTVGRWPGFFAADDSTTEETRWFDGPVDEHDSADAAYIRIDELAKAPTSIKIAEDGDTSDLSTLSSSDYWLTPYNFATMGQPARGVRLNPNKDYYTWPKYYKSIQIVGHFGYALDTAPSDVTLACCMQVVRWFKRMQQAMQTVGAIPEVGQLSYSKLDPDIAQILDHYVLELMA